MQRRVRKLCRLAGRLQDGRHLEGLSDSPIAAVALTSLDEQPLKSSRRMLLSTSGRVLLQRNQPTLSEPVKGTVTLSSGVNWLRLVPLASDGSKMEAVTLRRSGGSYPIEIPTDRGTHWFMIEAQ